MALRRRSSDYGFQGRVRGVPGGCSVRVSTCFQWGAMSFALVDKNPPTSCYHSWKSTRTAALLPRREVAEVMGPSGVSDHIDRILHSQTFASKPQLRKLMGILAKNMDSQSVLSPELIIKELWPDEIRTKRSADVATEMNRLRHALKSYYDGEGANDPITITLPNRAATGGDGTHERPWIVAGPCERTLEAELNYGQQAHATSGVRPTPLWIRPLFLAGGGVGIIIIVGVLAFLFRPTLPAPRVTGSTQVTHDGRDKERLVTDGPRIYYSSYPDINPRLYQVPTTGGDAVPVNTSIPGTFVFDISHDRSELLVGSCYVGRTTSECPLWIMPALGRPPRRLGNISASDATWSPDGERL